jgi:3-hydroxyacyl-[acyl-carrier-protein] dehydratase
MASAFLIDFDQLDLSRTVVSKEQVLKVLKQRGTFEMVDGLLHFDVSSDIVVGFKEIVAGDWWTGDHIPGRPLFPGVLMIEAAAQICTYDFMARSEDKDVFVGFGGLNNTRFRRTVEPGCRLVMAGKLMRSRSRMFTYQAQGFVDQQLVFEAEIMGVVV